MLAPIIERNVTYTVILLALVLVATVSGGVIPVKRHVRPNGRIIGGEQVAIEDNPWQVSLRVFGLHTCGGALIAEPVILTAAHCIEGLIGYFAEIVSGTDNLEDGGTVSQIQEALIYGGLTQDLAVIVLVEPLTFGAKTAAIPFAETEAAAGDAVRVTGWGVLREDDLFTSPELYGVELTVVERAECQADYANVEGVVIGASMLCAGVPEGGKGFCLGDLGGPLTKEGTLVGIALLDQGCGAPGYPGVYVNILHVRSWIKDNFGV